MKLLEYKGKELLKSYNIPIQEGIVASGPDEVSDCIRALAPPYVLKAQVLTGGRGKAGGIKFAESASQAKELSSQILGMNIKNIEVKKVLIAQKVEVANEWYLSITLDRQNKCPMIIFSPLGGIDIEETAKEWPDKILKVSINPLFGMKEYTARYIFKRYDLDDKYFPQFADILKKLYRLYLDYDATLFEINPLAVSDNANLIAVDCKADIDDSALYRHQDLLEYREASDEDILVKEARKFNFLYIPVDNSGDIAIVSNGSGMLMSCIDLITKSGAKACAALDLGGGATSDRIAEAIKIVFKNPVTKYLLISIFGGITRCDEVAAGVKLAVDSGLSEKTIVIRLEGTNKEAALDIISSAGKNVIFAKSISDGVGKLKAEREK